MTMPNLNMMMPNMMMNNHYGIDIMSACIPGVIPSMLPAIMRDYPEGYYVMSVLYGIINEDPRHPMDKELDKAMEDLYRVPKISKYLKRECIPLFNDDNIIVKTFTNVIRKGNEIEVVNSLRMLAHIMRELLLSRNNKKQRKNSAAAYNHMIDHLRMILEIPESARYASVTDYVNNRYDDYYGYSGYDDYSDYNFTPMNTGFTAVPFAKLRETLQSFAQQNTYEPASKNPFQYSMNYTPKPQQAQQPMNTTNDSGQRMYSMEELAQFKKILMMGEDEEEYEEEEYDYSDLYANAIPSTPQKQPRRSVDDLSSIAESMESVEDGSYTINPSPETTGAKVVMGTTRML